MKYTIYKLTSPSGKFYIGWTSQTVKRRCQQHKGNAKFGSKIPIHRAIVKYPLELWQIETLYETTELEESWRKEQEYIKQYRSTEKGIGYNCALGGQGGNFGRKGKSHPFLGKHHIEETKEKLRQANLGKKHSEETKEKLRQMYKNKTYEESYGKEKAERMKLARSIRAKKMWSDKKSV